MHNVFEPKILSAKRGPLGIALYVYGTALTQSPTRMQSSLRNVLHADLYLSFARSLSLYACVCARTAYNVLRFLTRSPTLDAYAKISSSTLNEYVPCDNVRRSAIANKQRGTNTPIHMHSYAR